MGYQAIKSFVNKETEAYKTNVQLYEGLLADYAEKLGGAISHGPLKALEKHRDRGKLLARERINLLLDKGTPFLELSPMAAFDQYNNEFPSAGIVTGIGLIHGRECVVVANDASVKGGTYIKETIKKHIRAQEIAMQNHLPCIYLVDSGGVFLPEQANVFPDRFDFGRIFYNQAQMSAEGIPQISVVMGSCTAGGAYVPAMSDEVVMVKNQATIFIGGPPLVKAATGEDVSAEELGGADVHTKISGVADHLAEDDVEALKICRNIVLSFKAPDRQSNNQKQPEAPLYPMEEMYGLISLELKKQINAYELIARLTDGSNFQEFKAEYGKSLVTGFAHIMGFQVGFIANNSFLTSESALKGAHFIELCTHREVPIIFLQNITGFIVGKKHEHSGIARSGAKLIHAVANASVPKITLVFGGSYGAGNYAMAGRAYDPNFLFMWPNAKISVMGGEQAASVLNTIGNEKAAQLTEQFEKESTAYYSTSRLWDDGIIEPENTREVLAMAVSTVLNKKFGKPRFGVFRM